MVATGLAGWAALSTGGLRALVLPSTVVEVVIAVDHDEAGLTTARAAGTRWAAEGRTVRLAVPPTAGMDWNDVLMGDGHGR